MFFSVIGASQVTKWTYKRQEKAASDLKKETGYVRTLNGKAVSKPARHFYADFATVEIGGITSPGYSVVRADYSLGLAYCSRVA